MIFQFLQSVTPSDITGAVDQLSKSSVELAEAAANFGALKVIFGVFMVFCIIIVLLFLYQTITVTKKVSIIQESTDKAAKMIEETSNRTLGKPQASILIRRSFNQLAQSVKYQVVRTRLENHLDQKDRVVSKIEKLMTHEYAELGSFLANFMCEDKCLSTYISVEDAKIISDFITEQVYLDDTVFTVSGMDQAAEILVSGLRMEALKGIE